MRTIKLFEEFNSEEFEQEEMVQPEETSEETSEEVGKFDEIIELLSDAGDVDEVECNEEDCEFIFNDLEFKLTSDGEYILVSVTVDDVSDTLGEFRAIEVEKITDVITKYQVS